MTELLSLPTNTLLDRFASGDPTPGGGSAAALAGALAAALVEMVAGLPKTRTGAPDEREKLDAAKAAAGKAGARLRQLVDLDTDAYNGVTAAYRLPKATDDEKAARTAAIQKAMRQATEVPLETCECAAQVLRASAQAEFPNHTPSAVTSVRRPRSTRRSPTRSSVLPVSRSTNQDTSGRAQFQSSRAKNPAAPAIARASRTTATRRPSEPLIARVAN